MEDDDCLIEIAKSYYKLPPSVKLLTSLSDIDHTQSMYHLSSPVCIM